MPIIRSYHRVDFLHSMLLGKYLLYMYILGNLSGGMPAGVNACLARKKFRVEAESGTVHRSHQLY